ncbi:nucleolar protein 9 [Spea bombifrons]|uniref:nucleolar protein 9 n=1 Tax=Spea bombifrons TaxID=233779 RepID=UPI0023493729|nr:nucleolar protein 9 [Spea bombifrons]
MEMGTDKKNIPRNKRKMEKTGGKLRPSSDNVEAAPQKRPKQSKSDQNKRGDRATEEKGKTPTESPRQRLDPKSVGYFRRVGESLQQQFESDEDRGLFVANVFGEVKGNELTLASDMSGSLVLQKLLSVASSAQLRRVLGALSEDWEAVCWHRSGAHVVQTALLQYPRLQNQQETGEEEETEEESDAGSCSSLEDLVLSLCSELKEKFLLYNQNTHGSFIVRTVFQVLSGVILNPDTSKQKGFHGAAVKSKFDVPETFLQSLQELSGCFTDHIGVFSTNKIASLGMQVALQVLKRKVPSACAELCDQVIDYLSSRNVNAESSSLLVFLKDETSSRLLERILEVSEKKQLQKLFRAHFRGQLQVLSSHPIANYTVQRLITATQTKKMFTELFEELCGCLEDVLAKGHMGIITTLAEACKRLNRCQPEFLSHLMGAFHCAVPASRGVTCVPLFLSLLTYEVYYNIEEKEEEEPSEHEDNPNRKLESVNYHGSLVVQHLLHFEDPMPALNSLGCMTEADLLTIACSQAGSHVFDALLNSSTITDKQRKKVLKKLRAHCTQLACNKHGSRVLDRMWAASTMGVKEEIAQKLVERLGELQKDPVGHHIARNFALTHFVKRRKDWEEHQEAENKRRKMFADILDD